VDDFFDFKELRVRQPGKILPGRASFEIFDGKRNLLAAARETQSRSVLDKITQHVPGARVLEVTSPVGEYMFTLDVIGSKWIAELTDADGALLGKIRIGGSRRHYTLVDAEGAEIGQAVGDLSVTRFQVTGTSVPPFAEIRKTFAGPLKEAFTSADHYTVKFGAIRVPVLLRTLTVMVPIVLDLAKYDA
jgi:Scramblase